MESHVGKFEKVDQLGKCSDFFVSNFKGDEFFVFTKSIGEEKFDFSELLPKVQSKEEYLITSRLFLNSLIEQKIGKAVLSRVKSVLFDETNAIKLFNELVVAYPNAFVYMISSHHFGTWIGASPEILLKTDHSRGTTISLAGTLPIGEDQFWSSKENEEQNLVTLFIEDILNKSAVTNLKIGSPTEVQAGPLRHLRSEISFDLNGNLPFEIARSLHPTPAVSGFPQKNALELIDKFEEHDRMLYAGMIGVFSEDKSDIYVNLRCCSIHKGQAYLFLGGGYTKDSIPEKEWQETENKSKTLLNIFQKM